jgi:CBS domain-containing protein
MQDYGSSYPWDTRSVLWDQHRPMSDANALLPRVARSEGEDVDIREYMKENPTTVRLGQTLQEAADLLSESQASDLMVVDDDGRLVGVLSEGDLLRAVLPHFEDVMFTSGSLTAAFESFVQEGRLLCNKAIDDYVIEEPIAFKPYNHPLRAAATMVSRQIRRLPVIDDDSRLVGTISRADVARALFRST